VVGNIALVPDTSAGDSGAKGTFTIDVRRLIVPLASK
jgi:hypothetical protein